MTEMLLGVIAVASVAVTVYLVRSQIRISGPALVVRRFAIDREAPDGIYLSVEGRAAGFTAWLLSTIGVENKTTLVVDHAFVVFCTAGISGQVTRTVPLKHIASTTGGFAKPLWMLPVGGFFALSGLVLLFDEAGVGVVSMLIAAAFLAGYFYSKVMLLAIESDGGAQIGLAFKRGVAEGIEVDSAKAAEAAAIVNALIASPPQQRVRAASV